MALVDTGSTVTLVRPDILPSWTVLQPTTVQLRTVTGERAPMKGKGLLSICVGGKTVLHPVWVAAVQDPCILGLDFLRCTGCQLDLEKGVIGFQGGPAVYMAPPNTPYIRPPPTTAQMEQSHVPGALHPLAKTFQPPWLPDPCPLTQSSFPPPHPLMSMLWPLQTALLPPWHPPPCAWAPSPALPSSPRRERRRCCLLCGQYGRATVMDSTLNSRSSCGDYWQSLRTASP